MQSDYSYEGENLFFKHEISRNLPRDAYSMHSHNMYELLYFVSGDATHVIEDRQYKLKRGDLILIRPSKYHFISIDSACDYERYDHGTSARMCGQACKRYDEPHKGLSRFPAPTDALRKADHKFL